MFFYSVFVYFTTDMNKWKTEFCTSASSELQTLQTGEGWYIGDDCEAPQEPAATSDDWYVTAFFHTEHVHVPAVFLGCLTLDGKHVPTLYQIYCPPTAVCLFALRPQE